MNIFIGNLSYNVTEGDLHQAFEAFGQVASATVIKDKQSGRSKGFGFVEMPVQTEAQSAIEALNGQALKGRTITVNEARPPCLYNLSSLYVQKYQQTPTARFPSMKPLI